MDTLRDLRRNDNIVITRPDKGNGVVVMNKKDYVQKMTSILSQEDKFQRIGKAETCDTTLLQERALQAFLLRQQKAGKISKGVYERVRPVGASRPRMYGIPKIHKDGTPLRPILSMVNAPQHELAKWLAEVLKPVVEKYGKHTVKDTFDFCTKLEECEAEGNIEGTYMCSFDVTSLFTNIPLRETLKICMDTLYRDDSVKKPSIPQDLLEKLLIKATTEVEFSFGGIMYRQLDGVVHGLALGTRVGQCVRWTLRIKDFAG